MGGLNIFSEKVIADTISNSTKTMSVNAKPLTYLVKGEKIDVFPADASKLSGKIKFRDITYNYRITNNNGIYSFFLNNKKVYAINLSNCQVPIQEYNNSNPFFSFTYANGKVAFRHAGRNYYYLTTEKTNSETLRKLTDSTKTIISILLGFIPGKLGTLIGLATGIYSLKNDIFGHTPTPRWYTVKEYCTRGYEYYAWKTYTYRDSKRKHCISVKWTFKKVL